MGVAGPNRGPLPPRSTHSRETGAKLEALYFTRGGFGKLVDEIGVNMQAIDFAYVRFD